MISNSSKQIKGFWPKYYGRFIYTSPILLSPRKPSTLDVKDPSEKVNKYKPRSSFVSIKPPKPKPTPFNRPDDSSINFDEGKFSLKAFKIPDALSSSIERFVKGTHRKSLREDISALTEHLHWRTSAALDKPAETAKNTKEQRIRDVENIIMTQGISKSKAQRLLGTTNTKDTAKMVRQLNTEDASTSKSSKHVPAPEPLTLTPNTMSYGEREASAYTVGCMPAVYASTFRTLNEISKRNVDWKPKSVLDFGCGSGSSNWAVNSVWGDDIQYCSVDISQSMINIAKDLNTDSEKEKIIKEIQYKRFLPHHTTPTYDLSILSFSLCELANSVQRNEVLKTVWDATKNFMVVIEPGNSEGFHNVTEARDYILDLKDSTILAPCPHSQACPLKAKKSICNFGQRIQYPTFYNQILNEHAIQKMNSKIQKFCFVVFSKNNPELSADSMINQQWSRVLIPPIKKAGHVICDVCTVDGTVERLGVTKKHGKIAYDDAKDRNWGDMMPSSSFYGESFEHMKDQSLLLRKKKR